MDTEKAQQTRFISQKEYSFLYYLPSCWDCGCEKYRYDPLEIELMGIYKLTCVDCGRIIEGDRAKNILEECGIDI